MRSQDLLFVLVAAAIPVVEWPRTPPSIGMPSPRAVCPAWVETPSGVDCVDEATAQNLRLHSGDRIGNGRRGRMAPSRLAALAAPVDVNRATAEELASLDGVGPKLAARIVGARPFAVVDDVARVKGVGARRLSRLRERLTVALDE